jgi:adenylate cyclase
MDSLLAYIPVDRRQALVRGVELPDRTEGAALFADISGFTPLTEALVRELGPARGAEELTKHLNRVYDSLINQLHCYGGSVIGFSGDAITCWLDGDSGLRATACGLAMQMAMEQFSAVTITPQKSVPLAMKAAVAVGEVRRFLVGNPEIQVIEVIAGKTLDYLALAEHQANRGEVVLDSSATSRLEGQFEYEIWRQDEHSKRKFGVVKSLYVPVEIDPYPALPVEGFDEQVVQRWLLPPVYERLRRGQGEFLAEFRPAVSIFVRFGGIDYDGDDEAGDKLDTYIRRVQDVLQRYDGYLIQLTMGDKGSYLQAAMGAPIAHEDDVVRAVSAASELKTTSPSPEWIGEVQIGIAQGRMRTGAYGGTKRRTYGVLSDEVNLAARLMQAAGPGQVFVTESVFQAAEKKFNWQELSPLRLKGKSEPVTVFSLTGIREDASGIHLQEPKYALPIVGRKQELNIINDKLNLALQHKGQIIGITGEAGMGKSRLLAEVIRSAYSHNLAGFGGECQSYGTSTSYLVWHNIWRGFLGLDPRLSLEEKTNLLEAELARIDPKLVPRLPLLGAALNLPIPDNELTRNFDAKLRKSSLEALLLDCLRARAEETPLLIVLENCHWIDPVSHDLVEILGRAINDLPVLMIMAYRPLDARYWKDTRVSHLSHFTEIQLHEFSMEESEQLIRLKLEKYFGDHQELPSNLLEHVVGRAEGNPFYIEELINYLQDKGIDPKDPESLEQLDLPNSLHSLILTRIDQRTESQKITIKLASIIGRMFAAAWLWGAYPDLGNPEKVKLDLDILSQLDLTPLDSEEPELIYLFKHIVTQEVAYESLPYATRALLHNQLAQFVEIELKDSIEQNIDLLAFHYERSDNEPKKREYLLKAGEAAQANYANQAALNYYQRVLTLLEPEEQIEVMLKIGQVLELVGRWDDAQDLYQIALVQARELDDRQDLARIQAALGDLLRRQGSYAEVHGWLDKAKENFERLGDQAGVGMVLHYEGTLAAQQGDLEFARLLYEQSLRIRRELDDKPRIASLLSNLGIIEQYLGDYDKAKTLCEEGLEIRRSIGDRGAIQNSLNNLGNVSRDQGKYDEARSYIEEAVEISQEIGDRWATANSLNNLANVVRAQGDYSLARSLYLKSLSINFDMEDKWALAYLLEDMGNLAVLEGEAKRALQLVGAASVLREAIGAPLPPSEREALDKIVAKAKRQLDDYTAEEVWSVGRKMSMEQAVVFALEDH